MPTPSKKRLDQLLLQKSLASSRAKAQAMILSGEVWVERTPVTKVGQLVNPTSLIEIHPKIPPFVSRGGIKLSGALDHFHLSPLGWNCLDVGASTGGFSDCLLQRGALQIFAIDVGRGQLDPKIRNHPNVVWKESFHVKELKPSLLPFPIQLAVVDVSFISLRKVLPYVVPCLSSSGILLALIKPQFEASKKEISKGGVLRDETKRQEIIFSLIHFATTELCLQKVEVIDAVIQGPKGNKEAFLFGTKLH